MFSKIKLTKDWLGKIRNDKAIVKFDNSRRKFITGASAIVSSYAFVGAGFGVLNKNDYKIEYVDIPVKNLSDEFVRTKFTFISDIHSGPYMDESLMNDYVEILNNLNSDYLFISGDLTNSMIEEAHPFSNAFKRLETNKGIYATLGNHDYFSDAEEVSKIISNETPIKIMRNESELLDINGDKLCLLGIDDTRDSGGSYNQAIIDYLDKAIIDAREKVGKAGLDYNKITKVLIYHKPYLFKDISEKNIDLTLSGHTHGGQVVLAKFGNLNISLAATVSEYISGLYRHGGNSLYVSRGLAPVGLPIRLNCPPEITVMRLVKQ
ncbi:MAG: phosphohydrolase [Chlorobi bacterium OLB4]|mgnify:FL=1|jgi:Predicted phosphohydrolases|nr:MAG: phosphohydrolase [Chlorobi bacterium OLB4]MBV6398158.1 hypothetical protein [Ignavibacteria bacterium]